MSMLGKIYLVREWSYAALTQYQADVIPARTVPRYV